MSDSTAGVEPAPRDERNAKRPAAPWIVVGAALLGSAIGVGVWLDLPALVLPTRVVEGPLIQRPQPATFVVVWYQSRESATSLRFDPAFDPPPDVRVEGDGKRRTASVSGLPPASRATFVIEESGRALARGAIRTPDPSLSTYSFVVFGDSGEASAEQYAIADVLRSIAPDFVVHTGDLIYPSGQRKHYQAKFFEPYAATLADTPFWPSLGNHDVARKSNGAAAYREVFELPTNGPATLVPETNYWFDYANARFVVLDSNLPEKVLAEQVAPWLSAAFADADADWRFVVFHHPPYTAGKYPPNDVIQRALVPAFEASHVDVVFNGHDHLYERTHALHGGAVVGDGAGVVYVVSGGGGAELYHPKEGAPRPDWIAVLRDDVHSLTHVRIDGRMLHLAQRDLRGLVIDEWTLGKPAR